MRTRRETAPAKPGRPARFRALVRVLEADPQAGIFTVTVPAWGPDPLTVRYEDVPGGGARDGVPRSARPRRRQPRRPIARRASPDRLDAVQLRKVGAQLDLAPHPYRVHLMDAETGRELEYELAFGWAAYGPDGGEEQTGLREQIAQMAGYSSLEEAKRRIVPAVPLEIRRLAEFGQLFSDERKLLSLRPALRIWWA